jgi:hypothetical protein
MKGNEYDFFLPPAARNLFAKSPSHRRVLLSSVSSKRKETDVNVLSIIARFPGQFPGRFLDLQQLFIGFQGLEPVSNFRHKNKSFWKSRNLFSKRFLVVEDIIKQE